MLEEIIQIVVLLTFVFCIKKFGLITYGIRRVRRSYVSVTENENGIIALTVKEKFLGILDRDRTYELKYIKVKYNIKEVKEYFDIVLKDREYIIRRIETFNILNFKKRAIIYIRDPLPVFDKIPTRFLPDTELKSIISEMVELNIVELEKNDFKTFTEKLAYTKILRRVNKAKETK